MTSHPWHAIPFGKKAPEIVTAVIEISKGSKNKYEIDKDSGLLFLDRVLSSSVFYPTNYGFIPQTYCDDGDALDILVVGQEAVSGMTLMNAKVLGAMQMVDGGEQDDKILAVHADDPQYKHMENLSDLNPHQLKEIEQFFRSYKALEKKVVEIKGWVNKEAAFKIIQDSIAFYKSNRDKLISK
jgi:inorganic pyrophosphatase